MSDKNHLHLWHCALDLTEALTQTPLGSRKTLRDMTLDMVFYHYRTEKNTYNVPEEILESGFQTGKLMEYLTHE